MIKKKYIYKKKIKQTIKKANKTKKTYAKSPPQINIRQNHQFNEDKNKITILTSPFCNLRTLFHTPKG